MDPEDSEDEKHSSLNEFELWWPLEGGEQSYTNIRYKRLGAIRRGKNESLGKTQPNLDAPSCSQRSSGRSFTPSVPN